MAHSNNTFIRFRGVYLQYHPGKALEMLRYMDIVRLAYTKWGGFGWRAYEEQFRALVTQYPKCWSIIDQYLWSLCVTMPTIPIAAPKATTNSHTGGSGSGPKRNGGFQKGGQSGNHNSRGGMATGIVKKGGGNQSRGKPVCRDYQMEMCNRHNCKFPHVCTWCRNAHPGDKCTNKR
jgi:hypothetical protein